MMKEYSNFPFFSGSFTVKTAELKASNCNKKGMAWYMEKFLLSSAVIDEETRKLINKKNSAAANLLNISFKSLEKSLKEIQGLKVFNFNEGELSSSLESLKLNFNLWTTNNDSKETSIYFNKFQSGFTSNWNDNNFYLSELERKAIEYASQIIIKEEDVDEYLQSLKTSNEQEYFLECLKRALKGEIEANVKLKKEYQRIVNLIVSIKRFAV